jgi:HSP20 family protein
MALIRWDPFAEMTSLRQAMDRLLENAFIRPGVGWGTETTFPLDVMERDDEVVVKASLPGVKPEDVNISIEDNVLTISGELHEESEEGQPQGQTQAQTQAQQGQRRQGRYHLRERRWGRFTRSVMLPFDVNADQANATFEHGVLTITLPKAEAAKKKRIQIQGAGQRMIEGQARETGQPTAAGTSRS